MLNTFLHCWKNWFNKLIYWFPIHITIFLAIHQGPNTTVFKITSFHNEYFGLVASWNYSEVGPCDAIASTSKRQADMAVRHPRCSRFFAWASSQQGCINYLFIWVEDYEDSEKFSAVLINDIQTVKDTTNVYAVKSVGPNKIKIRETSRCCQNYYSVKNLCDWWKEINLIREKPQEGNLIVTEHYLTLPFNSTKFESLNQTVVHMCAANDIGSFGFTTNIVHRMDYIVIIALFCFSENIDRWWCLCRSWWLCYGCVWSIDMLVKLSRLMTLFVSVLNHTGNLITSTKFNEPKQADEVLVKKVREPSGGTKGKRARLFLNEAVLGTIIWILSEWIKNN